VILSPTFLIFTPGTSGPVGLFISQEDEKNKRIGTRSKRKILDTKAFSILKRVFIRGYLKKYIIFIDYVKYKLWDPNNRVRQKVTASSGLILIMSSAKEVGLAAVIIYLTKGTITTMFVVTNIGNHE
jgi:hypothetical protein